MNPSHFRCRLSRVSCSQHHRRPHLHDGFCCLCQRNSGLHWPLVQRPRYSGNPNFGTHLRLRLLPLVMALGSRWQRPQKGLMIFLQPSSISKPGFIFQHFLTAFLCFFWVTAPRLDNVTDDHCHSWLRSQIFPVYRSGIILMVCFVRKRTLVLVKQTYEKWWHHFFGLAD